MDFEKDIRPISDFKRNTPAMLKYIKKTGTPMVLTLKGKAEAVVMSPAAYRGMMAAQEEMEVRAAIKEGIADAEAGRFITLDEFIASSPVKNTKKS